MVAYHTRQSSGVPWPRKNVSHWFNHVSGSSFPSKQGNSNRTVEARIVVVVSPGFLAIDELLLRLAQSIRRSPWMLERLCD
jgi:hypothetical protein